MHFWFSSPMGLVNFTFYQNSTFMGVPFQLSNFCHPTSAPPPPSRAEPAPALPPDSSGPGADSSVPASGASQESSFMETQVDETPLPKKPSFIDLEARMVVKENGSS